MKTMDSLKAERDECEADRDRLAAELARVTEERDALAEYVELANSEYASKRSAALWPKVKPILDRIRAEEEPETDG